MKNTKTKKKGNIMRYLAAPFKLLNNIFMTGMSSCAAGIEHHGGASNFYVGPQVSSQLPRNFSVSSSKESKEEDDLNELIRVVSSRLNKVGNSNEFAQVLQRRQEVISTAAAGRSYSVGIGKIGKIDEDVVCDFEEGDMGVVTYPRCKSVYTIARRNNSIKNNVYQYEKARGIRSNNYSIQ